MIRSAASAAPTAAGTAEALKMNAREETRMYSITSAEPAMKPPQEARLLEKVPIRRSTSSSRPKSSQAPAPRAPRTPTPWASSTIRRAPCLLDQLDDRRQVADVALHREDAVDDHQRPALVRGGALEHRLELVHPVVAEGPQARS